MLGDDAAEALDVFEGAAHEHGVGHALAIVGEDAHLRARAGHRAESGQMLALQALGDRADGAHLDPVGLLAQAQHLVDDGRAVLRGRRVRHRVHGCVAADGGRVGVNIDEAGQGDEALRVDDARVSHGVASVGADRDDRAAGQRNVGGLPAEQRSAGDQDVTGLFSHCYVLPMRGADRGQPYGYTRRWKPARR